MPHLNVGLRINKKIITIIYLINGHNLKYGLANILCLT